MNTCNYVRIVVHLEIVYCSFSAAVEFIMLCGDYMIFFFFIRFIDDITLIHGLPVVLHIVYSSNVSNDSVSSLMMMRNMSMVCSR